MNIEVSVVVDYFEIGTAKIHNSLITVRLAVFLSAFHFVTHMTKIHLHIAKE